MISLSEERKERRKRLWRRCLDYSLGIVIESLAVGTIAMAALGVMYLVKILVK
jgi:uncharacterized membrane protein